MLAANAQRTWTILAATAALWLGACSNDAGGGGGRDSLAELGIDDGASTGDTRMTLVKAGAEADIVLKTGARLSIPEGAVDDDVQIVMKRPPDDEALPLVKMIKPEYKAVSAPYIVKPHGQTFNKDIELSLPVGKGKADRLEVAFLDDEQDTSWEIHGKPKLSGDSAQVAVKHFSVYVLLERVAEEPEPDGGAEPMDGAVASSDAAEDVAPDADAASSADASTRDAADSDGSFAQRLEARLSECGLLAQSGMLNGSFDPDNGREQCAEKCLLDAACLDLESAVCLDASVPTDAYQTCVLTCYSFSIVECVIIAGVTSIVPSCDGEVQCMDGSDEANCPSDAFLSCLGFSGEKVPARARCDGYPDCEDHSDERDCPPGSQFVCDSGELLASDAECDGFADCADSSDEARCPQFQCRDGAQQVPQAVVCNLTRDCSDGSDEDKGCLKLTCEPRGNEPIQPPIGI